MLAALAFLTSPIGRILAGLGLAFSLFVAGFAYGHHVADQGAEISALKSSSSGRRQFDARAAEEAPGGSSGGGGAPSAKRRQRPGYRYRTTKMHDLEAHRSNPHLPPCY
jgi:hypothetical protein